MTALESIASVLNRALEADRIAVSDVLLQIFECNERMARTVARSVLISDSGRPTSWVNALALINACLCDSSPLALEPLTASYIGIERGILLIGEITVTPGTSFTHIHDDVVAHVLMHLNLFLNDDPMTLTQMMERRVECSSILADDPTVQVGLGDDATFRVGALGLINGILGIEESGSGPVTMHVDNNGAAYSFTRTSLPIAVSEMANVGTHAV